MYFGPGERLDNRSFEKAKADSLQAYGKEHSNSDFYPSRNRQQTQREAGYIMDRKTIIASLDVLSQNFDETDSIGEGLRAMAYTVSKMADEEFEARTAKKKVEFVKCPKCGNPKVMKQTGYCVKCGKKGIGKDDKKDDKDDKKKKANEDFWTKAASEAVALALVEDVVGTSDADDDAKKDDMTPDEKESKKKDDEDETSASKKKDDEEDVEAKKMKKEDEDIEAKKKDDEDEASASKKKDEEKDEVEAKKKDDEKDEVEAKKKDETTPPPEKKEDVEAKKMKKDEEEIEAKKKEDDAKKSKVNTDILGSVEGIEMDFGAFSLDEVELTASDKEQLDKLFQ